MSISKDEYGKMADKASPNSPVVLNCVKAFLFGGGIYDRRRRANCTDGHCPS